HGNRCRLRPAAGARKRRAGADSTAGVAARLRGREKTARHTRADGYAETQTLACGGGTGGATVHADGHRARAARSTWLTLGGAMSVATDSTGSSGDFS